MELDRISLQPLSEPGEVMTFYSYEGGPMRSAALSNVAVLLAGRDNATAPVLMLDWDTGSPGLHRYFGSDAGHPGLLEFFSACSDALQSDW